MGLAGTKARATNGHSSKAFIRPRSRDALDFSRSNGDNNQTNKQHLERIFLKMGKMKDELIGYLDEVVLPTVKGYGTLTAEEQNDLFALVQDQLLDNGQITVSAMSSATGSEATFTLDDLEQWSLTKQGLTLRELAGRTRLTPTRAGVVTERFFVCWYCPHETTNENEKHFC